MKATPPPTAPAVILKEKDAYQYWLALHRNFPRVERLGLGQKIEDVFLNLLELSFSCIYLPPDPKVILLGRAITKLDTLKFFTQLAWEGKLLPTEKYTVLSEKLEEIGKMLGGWRKGLQNKLENKTPITNSVTGETRSFGTTTR